jgi:hypothetical protein
MTAALIERMETEAKVLRDAAWSNIATTMLDGAVTLRKAREALFRAAPSHQGGHSDTGYAIALVLGVPFPINVCDVEKAANAEGYKTDDLWPWLNPMRGRKTSAAPTPALRSKDGTGGAA